MPAAAALCCAREGAPPRARSPTSKPLAATLAYSASSCISSFRAPGLQARPSSDGPSSMVAYAEQSPAYATAKQSFPRSRRRSLRTAAAPGDRENANLGKGACSRQSKADPSCKNQVGGGIGKKKERSYADHHRRAGQQQGRRLQQPRKICQPGCMSSTCVVS